MAQLSGNMSIAFAEDQFVNITGDTMTGDLILENGVRFYIGDDSFLIKDGQTVKLYVNNVLSASWEEDAVGPETDGSPLGLLLALTQQATPIPTNGTPVGLLLTIMNEE